MTVRVIEENGGATQPCLISIGTLDVWRISTQTLRFMGIR